MAKKKNEEMVENAEAMVMEVPEVEIETITRNNRVFVVTPDGEIPRKEWVIQMFNKDHKRGEIAKMLGVPVQTVFGYTKGITNAHHQPGVGRAGVPQNINVIHPLTGAEMPRRDVIRDLFAQGVSRSEIAKTLEISYQSVYQLTKPTAEVVTDVADAEVEE